ncbi:hypothetical protein I2483_06460 [Sporosarcina sp. E16_3]|uniref:hypothetical protein n=1 Tax=Sporosarcina sp. E16_3 TaxID=2789293 RepID=UPI001A9276E4|nr:hypothetical protein [Sporosarcina sp. E16_3]MBO0601297.1 hypothetical protein [Sporosarcina sp. E16_3]
MADMQLRDKMKKISEAAKHGDRVPERSKNAGLVVFLILIGCGIIVMLALAIGLMISKHFLGAAVICSIAALLTYSIYKLMKADDIEQL